MTSLDEARRIRRKIDGAWIKHDPHRDRIPAEAWRVVRRFKREVAGGAASVERALSAPAHLNRIASDFVRKGRVGRARALERLRRTFAPATVHADGNTLVVTWIEPQGPVLDSPFPSERQECVIVWLAGLPIKDRRENDVFVVWTIEVPDHALGRIVQRSPSVNLIGAVIEAHNWFINAQSDRITECAHQDRTFYLPAGNGLFVCSGIHCDHPVRDELVSCRAR